jgi:hypothetical protein
MARNPTIVGVVKWLTCVALCLPLLAGACTSAVTGTPAGLSAPAPDESSAVRTAFETYTKAVLERDGTTAASLIASPVHKFYDEARTLALTGIEDKVAGLPAGLRFTVYLMRGEVDPSVLRDGSTQDLLKAAVDKGLVSEDISDVSLGGLTVSGSRATGEVKIKGKLAPFKFQFLREEGRWKIDIEPLLTLANTAFTAAAKQQGVTVDELINQVLTAKYGAAKAAELRKPLTG